MPPGAAQRWWLHHSLACLHKALEAAGSQLILRSGDPERVLLDLAAGSGARVVAVNSVPDPAARAADARIAATLHAHDIAFHGFDGALLHDPDRLLTGSGGGYRVYTPFWRAFNQLGPPSPPLEAPRNWRSPATWPVSEPLERLGLLSAHPDWAVRFHELWTPGETQARTQLHRFLDAKIRNYDTDRDRPGIDGTSRLSAHLALGEISPRRIWQAVTSAEPQGPDVAASIDRFHKELVWREFCSHLLHHFPELAVSNWNPGFDGFGWREDGAGFLAWTRGETGYPIVDAGMRQLWQHGWRHNRVRMVTASFLIKHLLIDWRRGERWFRDTLVDADPAANAASWQWVAGSGADASPFFRIFNPTLQGEKFDAEGTYIRDYVPELRGLGNKFIHKPFEASVAELAAAGISPGKTYPMPLVDHRMARTRALAALSDLKDVSDGIVKKTGSS